MALRRALFGAVLFALLLSGCTSAAITPSQVESPSPTSTPTAAPALSVITEMPVAMGDCAIELRYNNVTVVARGNGGTACALAMSSLSFMGAWYEVDPATATHGLNRICSGPGSMRIATEVWDSGGAYYGTEICKEWNLPRR
jgi:hypothetical protein